MKSKDQLNKLTVGLKRVHWTTDQLTRATGPIVYIFWKGSLPLYVGYSECGLNRPLNRTHHKGYVRQQADGFEFICCKTKRDAEKLEAQLVDLWQPRYNEATFPINGYTPKPKSSPFTAIRKAIEADRRQ